MSRPGIRKCRQRNRSGHARARRLGARARRLAFEPLESRRLLTLAAFDIQLFEDADGVPGAPLEGGVVGAGDTFFVKILAEDVQPDPLGLHGISLDVRWDPAVFSVADPFSVPAVVTDSLPLFAFGTLEPDVGRINDLTGSAALGMGVGKLVGLHGPETFATIRFEARQAADQSLFTLRGGKYGIAFFPPIWDQPSDFYFDRQAITVVEASPASPAAETNVEASSGPVIAQPDHELTPEATDGETDANTSVETVQVPVVEASDSPILGDPSPTIVIIHEAVPDSAGDEPLVVTVDELPEAQPSIAEPVSAPSAADAADDSTEAAAEVVTPEVASTGSAQSSGNKFAEHETEPSTVAPIDICIVSTRRGASVPSMPPDVPRRADHAIFRPAAFIGPLLPHEYATRLILAGPPYRIMLLVGPKHLADDLADLLATDVNTRLDQSAP